MVQYNYIRFLYFNQKKSKRAIARKPEIHLQDGNFKNRVNIMIKLNNGAALIGSSVTSEKTDWYQNFLEI